MVKVSIIIPIYNVENYLEKSLDSAVNQSFEDIEIICINDGSTDDSSRILDDFAKNDSRIIILNQENEGVSVARNKALSKCKGDYVYFMDADDYMTYDAIEKLYDNAISNKSDIVILRSKSFNDENPNGKPSKLLNLERVFKNVDFNNFTFTHRDIKRYILNNYYAPWSKFFSKEFLDMHEEIEFPPNLPYNDIPVHVKSLLLASKISFVPDYLYYYRKDNPSSITHSTSKHINIFKIIEIVENFLIEKEFMNEYKNEFDLFKLNLISRHFVFPVTEEYYNLAKTEFSRMDLSDNPLIKPQHRIKYDIILDSSEEDLDSMESQIEIKKLENRITRLKQKNQKLTLKNQELTEKNKKLKRELKSTQDINNQLKNSKSWKITKPLRSIRK